MQAEGSIHLRVCVFLMAPHDGCQLRPLHQAPDQAELISLREAKAATLVDIVCTRAGDSTQLVECSLSVQEALGSTSSIA